MPAFNEYATREAAALALAGHVGERLRAGVAARAAASMVVSGGGSPVGIVDPFLKEPVEPGERFYIFLFPNTVTGLRHVWTHPAFMTRPPALTETPRE